MFPTLIEVVAETPMDVRAAQTSGATQVLLVRQLLEGSTSTDTKTIEACMDQASIPVSVLVKPDLGDYFYEEARRTRTLKILEVYWKRGVRNITFGAEHDGIFDWDLLEEAIHCGFTVNINQAFDLLRNPITAYQKLVQYPKVLQVVTSGKPWPTAEGEVRLDQLLQETTPQLPVLLDTFGYTPEQVTTLLKIGVHGVQLGKSIRDPQGKLNYGMLDRWVEVCQSLNKRPRSF
ncbi:copper homeostasis protein CutC [Deinococcus cellulosilyticus]|uniref:Uncharacterized protein n=1 Tax=Deinococcus cellulosilyticus (strain DSM 18568 / NBRC 106333 / KACC 11606 / 5516J-15) TaxID=1223518 RepID=A0A511N6G4_DEIC1|nr:copper homeostasis protein CutC [Deinococcus cellulosilyticus]GEM48435.1 hypothetical protein DC3_40700 [Deinococcus cellulosilyticus NBRC 106333 = KACC 11606]